MVAGRNSKEFWCPGSTLKVKFDNANPLAYGMPAEGLALFLSGNPAFEITPSEHNERYEIDRHATPTATSCRAAGSSGGEPWPRKRRWSRRNTGTGRVILIGFRAQHRAQTHGTFKLLFNALIR